MLNNLKIFLTAHENAQLKCPKYPIHTDYSMYSPYNYNSKIIKEEVVFQLMLQDLS